MTGGFKGLTPEEAQKLKNTADKALANQNENTLLKNKIAELEGQINLMKQQNSPLSPKNMKAAKEKADLENQLRILKKVLGISNAQSYDETVRQLKQKGLLQSKGMMLTE